MILYGHICNAFVELMYKIYKIIIVHKEYFLKFFTGGKIPNIAKKAAKIYCLLFSIRLYVDM